MPWYGFIGQRRQRTSLIEDKGKTMYALVRHTPLMSLIKWWLCAALFGLQPCDCGQAGRLADKNSSFDDFLKEYGKS